MARWLASGLRRDVCAVLAAEGRPTGQECKTALERHYEERVAPDRFYDALEALVERGVVEREEDGLHDRYALTEPGERRLGSHYRWLGTCLSGPGADDADGPSAGP